MIPRRACEDRGVDGARTVAGADPAAADQAARVAEADQRAEAAAAEGRFQGVEDRLLDNHPGDLKQEVRSELLEGSLRRVKDTRPVRHTLGEVVERPSQPVDEQVGHLGPVGVDLLGVFAEVVRRQCSRVELDDGVLCVRAADGFPHGAGVGDGLR